MTTKLLRQVQQQDQDALAAAHNGTDKFQRPRRLWAALELRPDLEERQWAAANRCVNECRAAFDGMRRAFDSEPVDGGGSSDYGLAARVSASGKLTALRHAARKIQTKRRDHAPNMVAWVAQLWTLDDMARAMECWRRMGGREPIADHRPAKTLARKVLTAMADHYEGEKHMNEYVMGVGEGWARTTLLGDDLAGIRTLEEQGFQVVVTPAGAVFSRHPNEPSLYQPQRRPRTVAA